MGKAQIISMDFILTFVVFLFAVSIFFFALDESYFSKEPELDINYDLMFSKLSNVYDEYSFLNNSRIIPNLDSLLLIDYNFSKAYEKYFQSFETPAFSRIDYCIYLQNKSGIVRNFKVSKPGEYLIFIKDDFECGSSPTMPYPDFDMQCRRDDALVYTKPVLYEGEIVELKILACGDRA